MRILVLAGCEGVPFPDSGWARPDSHGGVQTMSRGMAEAMETLGHRVEIACLARGNSLRFARHESDFLGPGTTHFTSLRQAYVLFHTLGWDDGFWRYLRAFDAVTLVCGSPYLAFPLLARSIPVLVWSAVTFDEDLKGRYERFGTARRLAYDLALPLLRHQERRVYEDCAHFWALSPSTLRDFRAGAGPRPEAATSVLYAPIDTERLRPPDGPRDRPTVLFTGRYNDPRKATPRLLRAFRRVVDAYPEARLRLVGDATSEEIRRQIRQLRLEEAVTAVGKVPRDALTDAYAQAQVFVIPSRQEGLCISAVEAMSCGLPVVSTRCGGPEAYVEHERTGLLADQNEASMAAQLLRILRDDELRARLGHEARDRAVRDFGLERFRSAIASVLARTTP
ncbi:MAG: glycosyltransferase family 4 protein [Myxococcota bacterium]